MSLTKNILCIINPSYKRRYVETKYKSMFEKEYANVNNIKRTLDAISIELTRHKRLHKLIVKSSYYLECSLLKDYKTALNFINEEYPNLTDFHNHYIEIAKQQQYFMLVDKGGKQSEQSI